MVDLGVQEGKLEIFIMEVIIVLLIAFIFFELLSISDMKKEIRKLEIKLHAANDMADYYRSIMLFNTHQTKSKNTNNQQILDAVKYAMKKSHPDNGGNAEDFKKFRDLYNSMK